jgi:hypothetical protein
MAFCIGFLLVMAGSLLLSPEAVAFEKMRGLAPDAPDNEVGLLRLMPPEIIDRIGGAGRPDANGLIGSNRPDWLHVAFQRGVMIYMIVSAARNDGPRVDDAWRAVDVSFDHQLEGGGFEMGDFGDLEIQPGDDASGVSFWMAKLCHGLVVLEESDIGAFYSGRIADLLPAIRETADWLAAQSYELAIHDNEAPNRLFFNALAVGFAGLLLEDPDLVALSHDYVDLGLAMQREDGAFIEHGGHDSSYQAVSLLLLQQYALRFGSDEIWDAIVSGMAWELSRIGPSGEVDTTGNTRTGSGQEEFLGTEKQVDYKQVVLALLYYSACTGDASAADAAMSVYNYACDIYDYRGRDGEGQLALLSPGRISRVYPNPLAGSAQIELDLRTGGTVSLTIYDTCGRLVRTLVDAQARKAGYHAVVWDGTDESGCPVADGLYFCDLVSGGSADSRKVLVVR